MLCEMRWRIQILDRFYFCVEKMVKIQLFHAITICFG